MQYAGSLGYGWVFRSALFGGTLLLSTSCMQSAPRTSGQAALEPANPPSAASAAPSTSTGAAAPAPSIAALKDKASMCGRSLGIAVRCNMVADQNDFAILRYNALNGLRAQNPTLADFSPVESAFDMSALEMMHKVGACQGAAPAMTTLEQKIQGAITECAQPKP